MQGKRRQGVKASDCNTVRSEYECSGKTPFHVLLYLRPEIQIEGLHSTRKCRPDMSISKRLYSVFACYFRQLLLFRFL